jgi:hypothetical protein
MLTLAPRVTFPTVVDGYECSYEQWIRFNNKLVQLDGCLIYAGQTIKGYGVFGIGPASKRQVRAHRLMFHVVKGDIPNDRLICHECDNPPCCCPGHLYAGTHQDNMDDKIARGRVHPYKMTLDKQAELLQMAAKGIPHRMIANRLNVSLPSITKWLRRLRNA